MTPQRQRVADAMAREHEAAVALNRHFLGGGGNVTPLRSAWFRAYGEAATAWTAYRAHLRRIRHLASTRGRRR